jgi:hypothetical protein
MAQTPPPTSADCSMYGRRCQVNAGRGRFVNGAESSYIESMTDLTADEMQRRIHRSLKESAARFHPKVIVVEGLEAWGTFYSSLLDKLREHRWLMDNDGWYPPEGAAFEAAYEKLHSALPVVPGMSRENMLPLMEGSYPDADVWIEQFASYPELHRNDRALVLEPARMTPVEHIGFLKRQAERHRLIHAYGIAAELESRAEEISTERWSELRPPRSHEENVRLIDEAYRRRTQKP